MKEVFPVESYDGRYVLDFVKYELSSPKTGRIECLREGQTYAAPLHVTFRLKDGDEVREEDVARWLATSREIQWDYKNIRKTKGALHRLT